MAVLVPFGHVDADYRIDRPGRLDTTFDSTTIAAMSHAGPSTKPVTVSYCTVCTLPTEYCEFGPSFSKCKTSLEANDKAEYERLWGEGE